jgi:3-oxoacyl-(acyl-carrier-protein) synthase
MFAEIVGFAATQAFCEDTVGLKIESDGQSIADAIHAALGAAGVQPGQIDAIAPFGSGIAHIDASEAAALTTIFGDRVRSIPLITTIPNVGNCCAGASAVSLIAAAMALKTQTLPARLNNAQSPGSIKGLAAAAAPSKPAKLDYVLVSSTGMGGQNAAVVLKKL